MRIGSERFGTVRNGSGRSGVWRGVSATPIDPLLARTAAGDTDRPARATPTPTPRPRRAPASDQQRSNDPGALHVLEGIEAAYQRLYPQLVRLAFLLVDTTEHAEEAVQDAFAKAYPKWSRIENPDAYMRMAVVNTCRRVQRRRMLVRRTPMTQPDDAVLGADHVSDVVRALPMAMRRVVVLHYYLQLSQPEIANTLGIPEGTVKSTLNRARARLKEELR
jgi:RNA polymerase sigma-70 factor (ECF subfamily)